jgi:hypothetical protein
MMQTTDDKVVDVVISIHWDGCWRRPSHHACLLAKYTELVNENKTLQWRLDDAQRKLDAAQDELSAAAAQVEQLQARLQRLEGDTGAGGRG